VPLQQLFAAEIQADPDAWVAGVLERVRADVPGLIRDDRAGGLAAASSRSLLVEFAAALVGDPEVPARAPEPALQFARYLARTDVPLSLLLRSFRIGQELLFSRAAELVDDGDLAGLRDVGLLTFRYVDVVAGEAAEIFDREREAVLRGSALRRERLVARLLAGEEPPTSEVERVLGWRMHGAHRAAVAWAGEGESEAALRGVVRRVLAWAGPGAALTMPGPSGELYAWVHPSSADLAAVPAELVDALAAAGVRVAFGDAATDLAGFVASRRQAETVRRLARYLPSRTVLVHADVALLNLLLADPAAAAGFVASELGALAAEEHRELRSTALVYLEHGQDTTATAAALGVHRNTVMRRLARAHGLLGRDLARRPTETLVGLLLADVGLGR
jgi:hypothetical protein